MSVASFRVCVCCSPCASLRRSEFLQVRVHIADGRQAEVGDECAQNIWGHKRGQRRADVYVLHAQVEQCEQHRHSLLLKPRQHELEGKRVHVRFEGLRRE